MSDPLTGLDPFFPAKHLHKSVAYVYVQDPIPPAPIVTSSPPTGGGGGTVTGGFASITYIKIDLATGTTTAVTYQEFTSGLTNEQLIALRLY